MKVVVDVMEEMKVVVDAMEMKVVVVVGRRREVMKIDEEGVVLEMMVARRKKRKRASELVAAVEMGMKNELVPLAKEDDVDRQSPQNVVAAIGPLVMEEKNGEEEEKSIVFSLYETFS